MLSTNIIKIIKQVILTIILTYVLGCTWYFISSLLNPSDTPETFITYYHLNEETVPDKLVTCLYYILTTLSTVGYGDFVPISILEKILGSIIMFCGVTFFSIMMNGFIGIVLSIKGESGDENEKDLDKWFLLMKRFKRHFFSHDLSKELTYDIEKHFKYFWENNRSATLVEHKEYFDSLPRDIR